MNKTIGNKEYSIDVFQDDGWNPREDSNIGTMICSHRNYDLGDEKLINHGVCFGEDFFIHINEKFGIIPVENDTELTPEECSKIGEYIEENIIYKKLYLLDHSGITMNTGGFSCSWDSGQVGYIYTTVDKAKEELIINGDESVQSKAEKILEAEVERYDKYLRGDFYHVNFSSRDIIFKDGKEFKSDWEQIEAMGGLDKPSDILDYVEDCPFTADEINECKLIF